VATDGSPCGCLALPAVIGFLALIAVLFGSAALWDLYGV
jgi:hypothetical protein